ncbi:hypothetical protein G8764_02905 [Pseudomaricurvus alcaniphilus]|uniref:hypothetical protein n=1 Tax=Pseudomaricurvus alcaniphilus TaxID=1166482 RepID=UPI00140DFDE1|nr:hypothetical protein [Pseudomaricurvus alcaniphilus]NHN36238.1 hypothetical protein [Pseudomaricurvus alcaniphilus]
MRPDYAYPQNLVSLCGQTRELTIANRGEFESSSWDAHGKSRLLLSSQLLPQEPAQQRRYQHLRIAVTPAPALTVSGFDSYGQVHTQTFAQDNIHCDEDGEMLLSFPSSSYYLWASVGSKSKVLALWTNNAGGLVLHNRWHEEMRGIVGGSISGDAWATFAAFDSAAAAAGSVVTTAHGSSTSQSSPAAQNLSLSQTTAAGEATDCANLSGDYGVKSEVVHLDGSLAYRQALEQFFRVEIIGEHPVNQDKIKGDRLRVRQDLIANTLALELYDGDEQLVSRQFESSELSCEAGRWQVKGAKKMASAWLLLIASGGVRWENLTLWRDHNGDLLVEGTHKSRSALFLIPVGDTRTLFMAFPQYGLAEDL